jgi:purine-binding chemotaxis protein CheW
MLARIMSKPALSYMLFSAGGRRYAVDVDSVDGIAEMLPEYPIPHSPRFLRGVVNIHGKLAAVVDLSLYLGTGPEKNGRNLLLLSMPGSALALVVEQMERLLSAEEILSIESAGGESVGATLLLADGRADLLELEPLINSLEKALVS